MALLRFLLEEYCSKETAGIGKMTLDGIVNDIICCFCVFRWLLPSIHRSFYVYQVTLHFGIRDFKHL